MLQQKMEVWTSFISCLVPTWKCPFQKGIYVGKNCIIEMNAFNWFPIEGYFWKFEIQHIDIITKDVFLCAMNEGYVTHERP